ncbi:MAG: MFS transporter, partial [Alphaproteobacteria bacterium]
GAREAFGLVGLVIAVSLPTLLAKTVPQDHVFLWYAGVLTVLMGLGVWAFLSLSPALHRAQQQTHQDIKDTSDHGSLFLGLRALPRRTLKLFFVYAVSMLASSIPAVLVIFYVRDLLGAEDMTGPFLLLYFLSGALGMPLWKKISMRHGKHRAWLGSKLLAVGGFVGAFFLGAGDVWPYAVVCVVSGMALGADLTLPPSLLSDDIHRYNNHRFSGIHYACLAFLTKSSLALASVIALPLLDAAGFQPQAVNTPETLLALSWGYALIPCVFKLIAAGFLYAFFIKTSKRTV